MSLACAAIVFENAITRGAGFTAGAVFSARGDQIRFTILFDFAHGTTMNIGAVGSRDFPSDACDFGIAIAIALEPLVTAVTFLHAGHLRAYTDTAVAAAIVLARNPRTSARFASTHDSVTAIITRFRVFGTIRITGRLR